MKKFTIFVLLSICYLLFATFPAFAENVSLGIYPPIIQINATAPSNVLTDLTIQNLSDTTVELNIILKPFKPSDRENGQVIFTDSSSLPDPSVLDRIYIFDPSVSLNQSINELTLAPKQNKKLNLQIKIPNTSVKGDYYFSLVFVSKIKEINVTASQNSAGIASNILLTIGGKDNLSKGSIAEFSSPLFLNKGPVPFTVRIKNTSDHFITPKGNVIIKNMFGQTVGKIDLLPVNILSGSVRQVTSSSEDSALWPENFLLGPYTANLTLALSDAGPIFRKEIRFFALPASYIVSLIIGILLLTHVIVRVKSSLIR